MLSVVLWESGGPWIMFTPVSLQTQPEEANKDLTTCEVSLPSLLSLSLEAILWCDRCVPFNYARTLIANQLLLWHFFSASKSTNYLHTELC